MGGAPSCSCVTSSTAGRWRCLSPWSHGDSPQTTAVLERIWLPRLGSGRARTRAVRVLADEAYSPRANRAYLRRPGIRAVIAFPSSTRAPPQTRPAKESSPRRPAGSCTGSGTPSSTASTNGNEGARHSKHPPAQ
ncbi:transposase [Rhodococcus ruber BKS 20-38]|uniref:Transposase n=1 Tax=Rhodococcus ruber BKS 20-38 TaxID=1278076 RepID=M2XPE1_9NOCA|nr:transposase [Rhodococcus ruber BKS 20-38]